MGMRSMEFEARIPIGYWLLSPIATDGSAGFRSLSVVLLFKRLRMLLSPLSPLSAAAQEKRIFEN